MARSMRAASSPSTARCGALQWGVTEMRSLGVPSMRRTGLGHSASLSSARRNLSRSPLMTFIQTSSTDPFRSTVTGDPGEA